MPFSRPLRGDSFGSLLRFRDETNAFKLHFPILCCVSCHKSDFGEGVWRFYSNHTQLSGRPTLLSHCANVGFGDVPLFQSELPIDCLAHLADRAYLFRLFRMVFTADISSLHFRHSRCADVRAGRADLSAVH